MASDLKPRSIKISDATWERWQAMAGQSGVSVTALIIKGVDGLANDQAAEIAGLQAEVRRLSVKPVAAVLPTIERFEARPIGSLLKGAKTKKGRNNAQDQAAGGEDA